MFYIKVSIIFYELGMLLFEVENMKEKIPEVIKGETLISYLFRFCKAYYFDSISSLAKQWSMNEAKIKNNEFTLQDLGCILHFTKSEKKILYQMAGGFYKRKWGTQIYEKLIVKNKIKYCPICIKERTFHKKIWTILPIAICPDHKILLIEKCPGCKNPIIIDDYMFGFCSRCSVRFKQGIGQPVDDKSIFYQAQKELINKINENRSMDGQFFNSFSFKEQVILSRYSFFLLSGMKSFIDYGSELIFPFYNKRDRMKNQINAATAYGNVFWMYQDFPENFIKVLKAFQSSKGKMIYIQKPEFEKLFQCDKYRMIQKVYNDYWMEQFNKANIRKDFSIFKDTQQQLKQAKILRKDQVKEQFNITSHTINRLQQHGWINAETVQKGKNVRYLIEKESMTKAMETNDLFITKREAALLLGIQRDSIPKLIKAGFLARKDSPDGKNPIKRFDVDQLLKRYKGRYVENESNGIPFHSALIKYTVNGLTITKLLEFTQRGYLNPFTHSKNGSFKDTVYDEKELLKCMRILKKEREEQKGYYMKDVIRLLNIGELGFHRLMKLGVFKPKQVMIRRDGRKHYFFDKKSIDHFINSHLTIEEAANEFQISSSTIRKLIKKGQLTDALKGGCKHYLVSRKELSIIAAAK